MAEILSIRGEPLEQRGDEPDPAIIAMLEEFLEFAKRGELTAIVIVGTNGQGGILPRMHTRGLSCFSLLGGMEFLRTQIVRLMELNAR